ncbi:MAG: SusC/RagA family TonB-linked outer membrane protein [Prevotellaceae bacterium]|jgi:TonB-linked SusC/RagA family outer membrane protein|nr:SusC/RagA family TonB-linked outer membrane protein [Prevotellaceae bacterium]
MKKKLLLNIVLIFAASCLAQAQTVQISGLVTKASDGAPLSGVTVSVKNSNVVTVTNQEGKYVIRVPAKTDAIEFGFLGYVPASEKVNSRTVINVSMQEDVQEMEEVIVVGYGTGQKVGTVVGSVKKISEEEIKGKPSPNALDALQGRVAGVQIFTSSGEPSATSSIRIHGIGSLGASNTPLFVVDGIPIDAGSFQALNQNDFESVTFLKDASATSIYGARAANGVIYITSKKGKANRNAEISFTAQRSWSSLADKDFFNSFMNSKQLSDFWVETGYRTRQQVDTLLKQYPYDTKWIDYYYHDNVPTTEGVLSVAGGGGRTTYYISAGYFDAEGIAPRSGYSRYTLRTNVESRAKDWLKTGISTTIAYSKRQTNGWGSNNSNGGLFWLTQPFYTPYDPKTGEAYDYIPGANKYSPWYLAEKFPINNNDIQMTGSLFAEITPVKGLTIRTQHGLDAYDQRTSSIRMPSYASNLANGSRSENFYRNYIYTMTNTAEYKFSILERHRITALAGQEYIDSENSTFGASSVGMTDDRLILLGNGPTDRSVSQSQSQYAYFSLFGRVNYSFGDKYHANLNIREDRSSRFGKNNRSATFVSGGLMWDAKKENFIRDVAFITGLKVRASYGSSGNSQIGNYDHLATIGTSQYDGQTGWGLSAPGNPYLSWEEQNTLSFGFETRLFDRLNIEVEYYDRRTTSMLMDVPYPYTTGFSSVKSNVGKLQNKGVDITLDIDIVKTKDLHVNFYTAFNYNANKVLELFQGRSQWTVATTGVSYVVGKPISFYYPLCAGVDPADGKLMWYLPNPNDNSITTRDMSKTTKTFSSATLEQNTGKPRYAPVIGGFGLQASFKGVRLDAYFSYALDKYLINNDRYFSSNPSVYAGNNQHVEVQNYWKKEGDVAKFPKYGEKLQFDDHLIENASFMRLKSLTVSYDMPKSLLRKTHFFDGARIYITGRNLFTVTGYKGTDPERDSNLTLGAYPNTRQYSIGIELKF